MRSCALIEAMLGTLMLSSVTPSPARIIAPRGSPATPPQTPANLAVQKVFFGTQALDLASGLTDTTLEIAQVKRVPVMVV